MLRNIFYYFKKKTRLKKYFWLDGGSNPSTAVQLQSAWPPQQTITSFIITMRRVFYLFLEFKFKLNQIFLNGIRISRRGGRIPVSGEISEISVEKKNLGYPRKPHP
jgi:hypothetical protein